MGKSRRLKRSGPIARTEHFLVLAEWLLIVTLFFVMTGNAPPAVNEAHYWTKARHYWEPDWCARDPFLDSADVHFCFYASFGWLTRCMPLTAAAWVGRLLGWGLLAASWQWLSRALIPRPGYALMGAAVASVLWQWGTMSGEWVVGGLEAKVVSYALVFTALGCVLRRATTLALWSLAGAVALHPIVGLWSTFLVLFAWFPLWLRGEVKPARVTLLFTAILVVCVTWITWRSDQAPADIRHAAYRVYVYERLPHHLVLHRMEFGRVLRFAALVLVWGLMRYAVSRDVLVPDARARANQCLQRFTLGSLLLVAVGAIFDLLSFVAPDLAAAGLRFYWFRLADVAVPLGVATLLVEWLEHYRATRPILFGQVLSICLLLTTAGVASRFLEQRLDRRPGADRQGQVLGAVDRQQADERLWDWRQLCAWANEQTALDSLFLTPLYSQTFRWYAQRAELANWKDIPQDAQSIVKWADTIDRIRRSGLYSPGSVVDQDRLKGLFREFGVNYLVTIKELGNQHIALPLAYQNASYCVYRVTGELE